MKKAALVTGGSRGIGRAIAQALAQHQFDIGIADISTGDSAQEVVQFCEKTGRRAIVIQSDISKSQDRRRIVDDMQKAFGRIDLLVNNAGVAPKERLDILNATEASYDWVMDINAKGPYFLTQLVANWMIDLKQSDPAIAPQIVNISSISAYTSSPNRGEYCISKAAVSMMTQLYADRLAEYGIPVFEIRPGVIKTDMTAGVTEKYNKLIYEENLTPLKRWGLPEDIARAVCAIAQHYLPYSTGQVINVDGGFHMRRL